MKKKWYQDFTLASYGGELAQAQTMIAYEYELYNDLEEVPRKHIFLANGHEYIVWGTGHALLFVLDEETYIGEVFELRVPSLAEVSA